MLLLISSLFFMCGLVNGDAACTSELETGERAANSVELKFYRVQKDDWNSGDNSAKVSVQLSDQANAYCAGNPGACGLDSCCSSEFKDQSVQVVSGYPQNTKKDMLLKIYVDFPSALNASGTLKCVVGADTVRDMIGTVRQSIFDETGSWITYVDTEFYGIPPDHTLNAIIIPIAFVIVLGIIIAAVIMHYWNKRREAVAKRQKIIEQRKKQKTARVTPTYHTESVPKEGERAAEPKSEKPKRKDEMYMQSLKQKNATEKSRSIHSDDSAIKLDNEPRQRQTYAYEQDPYNRFDTSNGTRPRSLSPSQYRDGGATGTGMPIGHIRPVEKEPIEDDIQVDSEKKKKKKKKHKKHREPEVYENSAYNSTGAGYQQNY